MERREPPETAEGWYALHDLRSIDWDAWRNAPERDREVALAEGIDYLRDHVNVADADAGHSAVYAIVGHKADLMVVHLRPTTAHLDRAERRFEQSAFAEFTDRATSYVSVTEMSGYVHEDVANPEEIEDAGMRNYVQQRLYPSLPDSEHVCFYPMDKRRGPEDNWYDLPFDERADLMSGHGDIGRDYAGAVSQIITGSVGFDDYEWGVTLFADDATDIKHLLYEMRFDPSSSKYAEFGPFYFGRRFSPAELSDLLAGDPVGEDFSTGTVSRGQSAADTATHARTEADGPRRQHATDDEGTDDGADEAGSGDSGGRPPQAQGEAPHDTATTEELEWELRRLGIDPEDAGYGLVFDSDADAEELMEEVDGLRGNFAHYDTHVKTNVRADSGRSIVVSLWANERAANTASGFLADLSGVSGGIGGPLDGADASGASGGDEGGVSGTGDDDIRGELSDLDIYAGKPHGEDVYAIVLYSEAPPDELAEEVSDLSDGFGRYDTHVETAMYEAREARSPREDGDAEEPRDADRDRSAVVSLWETRDAADTAGDYLADLPGIVARAGEGSGFGTMGMFYTVKPDHREEFLDRFQEVGGLLADMDGHRETDLLVNRDDENDMFIASQWDAKEDALDFFRSDAFRDTVRWGREVLADRPRHVFLA